VTLQRVAADKRGRAVDERRGVVGVGGAHHESIEVVSACREVVEVGGAHHESIEVVSACREVVEVGDVHHGVVEVVSACREAVGVEDERHGVVEVGDGRREAVEVVGVCYAIGYQIVLLDQRRPTYSPPVEMVEIQRMYSYSPLPPRSVVGEVVAE